MELLRELIEIMSGKLRIQPCPDCKTTTEKHSSNCKRTPGSRRPPIPSGRSFRDQTQFRRKPKHPAREDL